MEDPSYIIVGGGAAGCALAARLAKALPDQSILLLDAGGDNQDPDQQSFGERYFTRTVPGYSWAYKTVEQQELGGRQIDYTRGKGLGGSTAVNFCVYTRGPSADYDHWAELVEDDSWSWKNSLRRFQKIERFHPPRPEFDEFVEVIGEVAGKDGPIDVCILDSWDPGFGDFMKNSYYYYPKNLDHNSGNPIGVSVCQSSANGRKRVTASGSYLKSGMPKLKIMTQVAVTKILFQGKKAVGVESDGSQFHASREVILTAGAVNSPKLLLLSGIGPAKDLEALRIPVIQDLPGVGKNLQDRLYLPLVKVQEPESHHRSTYIDSPASFMKAREAWITSQSGPLSDFYLPQMIGYLKLDTIITSQEFHDLESKTKEFLKAETKPHYEIFSQNPSPIMKAPENYLATAVCFPGSSGVGEIKLQSSIPDDHPLIDPKFLTHPFDKRVAIESIRETMSFLDKPLMAKHSVRLAAGPAGTTDEDISAYAQKTATSMWHVCGTVKMGIVGEEGTCVDKHCKVIGIEGLRVVDMSVAPFLPSAHTQAVAYLIGETVAEKIIAEHS